MLLRALIKSAGIAGDLRLFEITLFTPEPDPVSCFGDYRCKVVIKGGLVDQYIYGIDALQTVCLAIKYLESEFEQFIKDGWAFFLANDLDHPIDVMAAYFPKYMTAKA